MSSLAEIHCKHGVSMCVACQLCHLGGGKQVAADWPLEDNCIETWSIGPYHFTVVGQGKGTKWVICTGHRHEPEAEGVPYRAKWPVGSRLKDVKAGSARWAIEQFERWIREAETVHTKVN